jgi:hypothetical protein
MSMRGQYARKVSTVGIGAYRDNFKLEKEGSARSLLYQV